MSSELGNPEPIHSLQLSGVCSRGVRDVIRAELKTHQHKDSLGRNGDQLKGHEKIIQSSRTCYDMDVWPSVVMRRLPSPVSGRQSRFRRTLLHAAGGLLPKATSRQQILHHCCLFHLISAQQSSCSLTQGRKISQVLEKHLPGTDTKAELMSVS